MKLLLPSGFVIIAAVTPVLVIQPVTAQKQTSSELPIAATSQISEPEQPLTGVKWLAQASPPPTESGKEQLAQVTAVQLKPTDKGLEVILKTTGTFDEVLTSSSETSLITDIPNTQLCLPGRREFRQNNPTETIIAVTVTNLDTNTIRVTVTGKSESLTTLAPASKNLDPTLSFYRTQPMAIAPQRSISRVEQSFQSRSGEVVESLAGVGR